MPAKEELAALQPGWALSVVLERIDRLHRAAGTTPEDWLGLSAP